MYWKLFTTHISSAEKKWKKNGNDQKENDEKRKTRQKKKSQRQAILDIGNRLLNKTKAKNKKNIKKIKCYHSSLELHVRLFTKQGFCVWTHSHTRTHTHIHVVVKCFSSSKS